MTSIKRVRHNSNTFGLLGLHSAAYQAGHAVSQRDANMGRARHLRAAEPGCRPLVKLFVDFARDDHRKYLQCLRELKREQQALARMQTYETMVLDRVMGAMQR